MDRRMDELVADLEQVTGVVESAFAGLSDQQLNWKPAADRWSIAQCLDHLITINGLYFPVLDSMRTAAPTPGLWERYSPFSGVLGKLLIRTLSPENPKATKTSPKAEPSSSRIDGIVPRFAQHQVQLTARFRGITPTIDRKRTIVTSPLLRWVTYSLDDCLTILVVHENRHVRQAVRVIESAEFPKLVGP